jgi:general secretion pathway protein L
MRIAEQLESLRLPGLLPNAPIFGKWRDTVIACLPEVARRWILRRDRQLLVVLTSAARADLYLAAGDDRQRIGTLELAGQGTLPVLDSGARRDRERTVLQLPADQVLRRSVTFPAQVRENLSNVLRYEIDRISPFPADEVYFDFSWRNAAGRPDRLIVEIALCRRDRLQPWIERLREIGRPIDRLTWEGAWPRANLLSAADRPARKVVLFTAQRAMGLVALLLLVAVFVSPLWQRGQILERLQVDLRNARAEAVEVDVVRQALERAREGSQAVLREKVKQPRMTDLLRELTQRLPDDTWVQSLDVRDGEVQIRGESARATALIELLARTPGLDGVGFRSPVTQVAQTGSERFHIAFRFKPSAEL